MKSLYINGELISPMSASLNSEKDTDYTVFIEYPSIPNFLEIDKKYTLIFCVNKARIDYNMITNEVNINISNPIKSFVVDARNRGWVLIKQSMNTTNHFLYMYYQHKDNIHTQDIH